jgi:hypothetical protein
MKLYYKLISFILILIMSETGVFSQSPDAFNYQAVVRDSNGDLIVNQNVSFKISILSESISGQEVYAESHRIITSNIGTVALSIGSGDVIDGSFGDIQWGDGVYFIQTAIDVNNGSNYEIISTSQLLSVPYALYAKTSGDKVWESQNSDIFFDAGNVGINNSNPTTDLDIVGDGSDDDIIAIRNNDYARYAAYGASDSDSFAIPLFVGFKSRGTIASPTNLSSQDRITGVYGGMYVNNQYRISSAVEMYAGDNPGTGSYPAYIKFGTTPENGTSRQERMRISENGNVGIGTTNPEYKLDVSGTVNASEFLVNGTPLSSGFWSQDSENISYDLGNVGINNSNPTTDLDIVGDGSDDDIIAIRNNDYARYAAYGASDSDSFAIPLFVGFKSRGTIASPTNLSSQDRITGIYGGMYVNNQYRISSAVEMYAGDNPGTGSYPAYIKFGTTPENGTSRQERMRISENGNVGIGTETPETKVHVKSGDIYIEDVNSGVILNSPNGSCWRLTVDDSGSIVTTSITCPGEETGTTLK